MVYINLIRKENLYNVWLLIILHLSNLNSKVLVIISAFLSIITYPAFLYYTLLIASIKIIIISIFTL